MEGDGDEVVAGGDFDEEKAAGVAGGRERMEGLVGGAPEGVVEEGEAEAAGRGVARAEDAEVGRGLGGGGVAGRRGRLVLELVLELVLGSVLGWVLGWGDGFGVGGWLEMERRGWGCGAGGEVLRGGGAACGEGGERRDTAAGKAGHAEVAEEGDEAESAEGEAGGTGGTAG
jgi:hypothetical protein